MKEAFLAEKIGLKQAFGPADADTAQTGARIGLAKGFRVAIVISMGTSTAAAVIASLKQHNAASGGTSKALSVANPYYVKAGAATAFTKVEPSSASDSVDVSATFAADGGLLVLEVLAEDLDVNNNFSHVSVDLADSTAAKIVSGVYHLHEMKNLPAYLETL